MSEDLRPSVEAAWHALWQPNGTYELPGTLNARRRIGLSWFRPLGDLAVADTGPVVVLNSEPWGTVSLDLQNAVVSQFDTAQPVSFSYDAATDEVTAVLRFRELKFAGDYEAVRGQATASALKIASKQINSRSLLGAAADPNDPISLAKGYQTTLATQCGPNGNTMLNSYYRYNNQYSAAFGIPKFAKYWATYKTAGQNTSFYADHTTTAATPGNTSTVAVNGTGGDSAYNKHAFTMQMFLVASMTDPDAAAAATAFDNSTQQPADQPQTVDSVLNIVKTTNPSSVSKLTAMANHAEPEWRVQLRSELAPHCEAIRKERDDLERGILLREQTGAPIHAQFNAYFTMPDITLHGKVLPSVNGGAPRIVFSTLQSDFPEVSVRLGAFPGSMHADLVAAVQKAKFLKSFLGKRVAKTLQSSSLLNHVGRLMSLALAEQSGQSSL